MKVESLNTSEYFQFYDNYIAQLPNKTLHELLEDGKNETLHFYKNLSPKQLKFRYAEGKWTPQEILLHLIDTERIFSYRALRFARKDKTELAGYDENEFVDASNANSLEINSLLEEYFNVRNSTISLFKNFSPESLELRGIACGNIMSVRAAGFIIAGHERHHLKIISERYLP